MKVLSLTEPFATLISSGKKCIETRSWKTNYRGPLYIHVSQTKMNEADVNRRGLYDILGDATFSFGYILCECELVDCVYMTEEYVEDMKKNHYQEYLCGEYKVGRYAWVLENVKPLLKPIPAKGQLNIWNYYQDFEIMDLMTDIQYGWVDKEDKLHIDDFALFSSLYCLQSPKEVLKNKIGVCWDQVELERYYFSGWKVRTFFIVYYDGDKCPTHTFLTYEKEGKFYWFEHSWEKFRGIYKYDSMKDLLLDVRDKFVEDEQLSCSISENLCLYEYKKPKYGLSVMEFYKHCENGQELSFDNLE